MRLVSPSFEDLQNGQFVHWRGTVVSADLLHVRSAKPQDDARRPQRPSRASDGDDDLPAGPALPEIPDGLGFALQELTLPFETPEELAEVAESILRQFPADEYPYLAETVVEHVTKSGYDFADEFEFGLDLILDGLERRRNAA